MRDSVVSRIGSVTQELLLIVKRDGKTLIDLDNGETIRAWKTPLEAQR
jgi:hypothetical protein